jgi:SAM-dependent methyltransferase
VPFDDGGAAVESLKDLLARLERERQEADAHYNEALTAVDGALVGLPEMPHPPPPYDETLITPINLQWNILPTGAQAIDRSVRGRLRGFIWRLVGPPLERQAGFNAALVDHLNRNVAAHREAEKALATLIRLIHDHISGLTHLEGHLITYLQAITLYVDTKDRAVGGGQAQTLNAALSALAEDWLKRWESLKSREARYDARHTALAKSYEQLTDLVAIAQQSALTLKREVERLIAEGSAASRGARAEAQDQAASAALARGAPGVPGSAGAPGVAGAPDLDSFKYLCFEDRFRGSRDDIRARLATYLPLFAGASDVVDLGCGRGEFLDLLRERGVSSRGVDLNHEMVEVSRARGLEVTEGDALSYLVSLPDASLGGVFAAQVAEHLEPAYLMRLIETAAHKLRADGLLVLETINPACWLAFFESYLRDLTHVRPLHPETLQYLLRLGGFRSVEIEFHSPVADSSRLQSVAPPAGDASPELTELVDSFNDNVVLLNARMFSYQDYAVIGRK